MTTAMASIALLAIGHVLMQPQQPSRADVEQARQDLAVAFTYIDKNGDNVEGITVMALEEDEAVFVNVIGELKPDELGKVMENFDIEMGSHDDDDELGPEK